MSYLGYQSSGVRVSGGDWPISNAYFVLEEPHMLSQRQSQEVGSYPGFSNYFSNYFGIYYPMPSRECTEMGYFSTLDNKNIGHSVQFEFQICKIYF